MDGYKTSDGRTSNGLLTPWELLVSTAKSYGVNISSNQCEAFRCYYKLMVQGNRKVNLTRIIQERDVVLKHFLDSLAYLIGVPDAWHQMTLRLLDVGSGAGLPGIPLLLARPKWQGTLLEATRKKVEFLQFALRELGLSTRASARWVRAEHPANDDLAQYRLAMARAVGSLSSLVQWTFPYLQSGGYLLVSKGPRSAQELRDADTALMRMGGPRLEVLPLELPEGAGKRLLVVAKKR